MASVGALLIHLPVTELNGQKRKEQAWGNKNKIKDLAIFS